jgi:tetratricopeptide (TPR) repeat protein
LADVLRTDPEHPQGLLVRAEMLRRRGQLDQAVQMWLRGFESGAEDFDSRIRCGDVMLELGNSKGAIDQWQRAKACWPSCTEQQTAPELRLAKLYRDQGERTQAQMEMKSFCRRTARAFAPRYTLAEFEKEADNRRAELDYLIECNRIDPFYREMHVRMGEAYEALGQPAQAALEFEVAAAVKPAVDRAYLMSQAQAPEADSREELTARCKLWLRAAKLRHQLKDLERRDSLLQRVLEEDGVSDMQEEARDLQQEWRGR